MSFVRLGEDEAVWNGQAVFQQTCKLAQLADTLPVFTQTRFCYENALNEYLDVILREPHGEDDRTVPVATVSRRYALIQHRDLVDWCCTAFKRLKWDPAKLDAIVQLSEYGERMFIRVSADIAHFQIVVGDPLQVEVCLWNSVDRSRSLELAVRLLRLQCSNGLAIWDGADRMRKIHHLDWMSRASPVAFLTSRVPKMEDQVDTLRKWRDVEIASEKLLLWIDQAVEPKWGKTRAARLLHIARTGRDCSVGRIEAKQKASEVPTHAGTGVPGAPAKCANAYDLYQTMLWLAGTERSLEAREEKADEALAFVRDLVPPDLRGVKH